MSENDLLTRLDDELAHLPSIPPTAYLRQGKRVRRRRRAVAAGAVVAVGVTAVQVLAPGAGRETTIAEEVAPDHVAHVDLGPDPDYVAPEPRNAVEAVDGLAGVDWFTTADIPSWASEYGSHGPVALTPDGRLWVAPDAEVARTVVDPYPPGEDGITASYAVEARWQDAPDELADRFVWVIIATDGTGPGTGTMDEPGRWTDDFELWVDDATAHEQGRPSFAERLLTFVDDTTDTVGVGAEGVELLHQQRDPDLGPGWVRHTRAAAADVDWRGVRWYVVAVDPKARGAVVPGLPGRHRDRLRRLPGPGRPGGTVSRSYDSYVEFVAARQPALRRIAYAVCRDDSRAEDVLQEALVKLYLAWSRVQGTGREEAYARRIIVNADLDQRRRAWHRLRSSVPVEVVDRPVTDATVADDRSELVAAMRLLPPMQRRTVALRHLLGLSVEETARDLGIGEGTVKSHASRGLAALRTHLGEEVGTR
ncbi:SigE family RNA polymerase sigma factor [Nocardioides zeicaulis]|uniref:SigE family RNA polymerase sigma factor n=1 Tax=Nocardioides zeicaulis TaxID=1776857 RepID=A0ABV6E1M0_9ACTN